MGQDRPDVGYLKSMGACITACVHAHKYMNLLIEAIKLKDLVQK
jgi:hypothetical protein